LAAPYGQNSNASQHRLGNCNKLTKAILHAKTNAYSVFVCPFRQVSRKESRGNRNIIQFADGHGPPTSETAYPDAQYPTPVSNPSPTPKFLVAPPVLAFSLLVCISYAKPPPLFCCSSGERREEEKKRRKGARGGLYQAQARTWRSHREPLFSGSNTSSDKCER
ncbi:hypothetical protein M419DRAFT_121545, partial [Trichoderma reesei RUT C-30]